MEGSLMARCADLYVAVRRPARHPMVAPGPARFTFPTKPVAAGKELSFSEITDHLESKYCSNSLPSATIRGGHRRTGTVLSGLSEWRRQTSRRGVARQRPLVETPVDVECIRIQEHNFSASSGRRRRPGRFCVPGTPTEGPFQDAAIRRQWASLHRPHVQPERVGPQLTRPQLIPCNAAVSGCRVEVIHAGIA